MTPTDLIALPLFPLGSVLFPDGLLPLRVFELRYLQMVNQAHQLQSPFGVVALTHGSEVRVAGAEVERFSDVGTLAEITHYEALQPALLRIECRGTRRFRIHESEQQKNGLWIAKVQWMADDVAVSIPEDLLPCAQALRQVIATLEMREQAPAQDAVRSPIPTPHRLDDCGWVANRWCELLPMPPELKQRMMALDNPLMRLELVDDLLARSGITKG
ncbi:LON peptidase substrate-binding domain-containing protein [Variovorax dokdonensis]|uniref:LON peptidase substrate-binding domain-containing protein n=1 Tax=Variovorax dokdonensis TaxID=344883 RepID=A0ABT7N6P0_9BURK|nr:LON peptidase substrate-binding domain-containing protein [Variovorax dokdonensis]MDM0043577.1 LON peptidase substrate-binding domain-containing protein [Variovorax dokdonensis]